MNFINKRTSGFVTALIFLSLLAGKVIAGYWDEDDEFSKKKQAIVEMYNSYQSPETTEEQKKQSKKNALEFVNKLVIDLEHRKVDYKKDAEEIQKCNNAIAELSKNYTKPLMRQSWSEWIKKLHQRNEVKITKWVVGLGSILPAVGVLSYGCKKTLGSLGSVTNSSVYKTMIPCLNTAWDWYGRKGVRTIIDHPYYSLLALTAVTGYGGYVLLKDKITGAISFLKLTSIHPEEEKRDEQQQ